MGRNVNFEVTSVEGDISERHARFAIDRKEESKSAAPKSGEVSNRESAMSLSVRPMESTEEHKTIESIANFETNDNRGVPIEQYEKIMAEQARNDN